jgi:predicted RNase H-like nuclease
MCHGGGMRVTGVDACRRGWVAVSLDAPEAPEGPGPLGVETVRVHETLAGVLDGHGSRVIPARPQRDDRGLPIAIRY